MSTPKKIYKKRKNEKIYKNLHISIIISTFAAVFFKKSLEIKP